MLSWRKLALLAAGAIGTAAGQPALTTIQDILYRADGTRFTGTMFIRYNSFPGGRYVQYRHGESDAADREWGAARATGSDHDGVGRSAVHVTYNSQGINQFTEIWAVPPSTLTLRVRDVRVSAGTVIGPPPVTAPVQIGDVVGLTNELAVRPMKGVGFGIGRAAVINQAGTDRRGFGEPGRLRAGRRQLGAVRRREAGAAAEASPIGEFRRAW